MLRGIKTREPSFNINITAKPGTRAVERQETVTSVSPLKAMAVVGATKPSRRRLGVFFPALRQPGPASKLTIYKCPFKTLQEPSF